MMPLELGTENKDAGVLVCVVVGVNDEVDEDICDCVCENENGCDTLWLIEGV